MRVNDMSRAAVPFEQSTTLILVVEMGAKSWLVAGTVPGVERQPFKKLEPDAPALLRLIERWLGQSIKTGQAINRVVLAYEAGRDGFWLARWLIARGIEVHVIHSASVAVSRERKRAKTDRLDAAMLLRVLLGWLRGERGHCGMVAVPTLEEEDGRRPSRERESLVNEKSRITNRMKSALARLGIRGFKAHLRKAAQRLEGLRTPEGTGLPPNITEEFRRDMARLALVREQIAAIEKARIERLQRAPNTGPNLMVRLLARVIGISIETADMLVREILSRNWRDRRAVARYAGLTGSPDESGTKRREKGLAKAGNARVRRGLIQLAWRFLQFQKESALANWFWSRTEGPSGVRKTTMIVALARKLLIALWRLVTTGEVPEGVVLRPAVCATPSNKKGHTRGSAPGRADATVADDDRRWRQSESGYGCNAAERMDPPPRSLARRSVSLLHGQGSFGPNRIQACGASSCAHRQAPLGSSVEPYPIVTACRRAHVRQGQGALRAALKKRAVLARRCARRQLASVGRGEETDFSSRTKKLRGRKKAARVLNPGLDSRNPI